MPPTVREVIAQPEAGGWQLTRTRDDHRQVEHPTKPGTVTVAGKPGVVVPIGTWLPIRRQAGWRSE
jgi:predicted RNA binding protein YcfA (HicA-like mRNA interferase family)